LLSGEFDGTAYKGLPRFDIWRMDMRLDKYLKVSRLIKRRTVANEACDAGRVLINDKPAKASANVKAGDILTIRFGDKDVRVEILDVQETVKKDEAKELFKYL
jgi:ribosomal 50S subunit-recycling heat shock protein